jgi:HD-like signal output (HDOD) protein
MIIKEERKEESMATDALAAGMLHDVGKLVFVTNLPDRYGQALVEAKTRKVPLWMVEQETFGATHAEVGAYLFGIWGLPVPVIEAVAFHHQPRELTQQSLSPLTAVYVANVLEHEEQTSDFDETPILEQYLNELGVNERLSIWRQVVRMEI